MLLVRGIEHLQNILHLSYYEVFNKLVALPEPSILIFCSMTLVNKNIKGSSFESNENTQRQSVGHIAQFRKRNHLQ